MNIARIMVPKALTIFLHEDDTLRQGLETFSRHGYTAVPVLDARDRYIGSIAEGDFLRYMLDTGSVELHSLEAHRVKDILRPDFCPAISINAEEQTVIDFVLDQNFVPVVDDRNALCGIITRRELIAYMAHRTITH